MEEKQEKMEEKEATAEEAPEKVVEVSEAAKEVVVEKPVEEEKAAAEAAKRKPTVDRETWKPKTELGRKVKSGEITNLDAILDFGKKIMEAEIVDLLLPDLTTDLLLIGQSKGKFGGGQRRVFKQTQKKTMEGNKPKFATFAVVGNGNGYVGVGYGKSKETVPAREKAFRNAKINVIKISRGCGSWECGCGEPHTIPYMVEGKCGSVIIRLMPAPKGTGLCIEKECAKILKAAGIKDVWSRTFGKTSTKTNTIVACMEALKNLLSTKVNPKFSAHLGIVEGPLAKPEIEVTVEKGNE